MDKETFFKCFVSWGFGIIIGMLILITTGNVCPIELQEEDVEQSCNDYMDCWNIHYYNGTEYLNKTWEDYTGADMIFINGTPYWWYDENKDYNVTLHSIEFIINELEKDDALEVQDE